MAVSVFACVCESVFLKGFETVFPAAGFVYCGGAVDEPTLFDLLPSARPDVLVYELPSEQHLPYLSLLRRNWPGVPVVVLFESEHVCLVPDAITRGAAACLAKTATSESLLLTLERVLLSPAPRPVTPAVQGGESLEALLAALANV